MNEFKHFLGSRTFLWTIVLLSTFISLGLAFFTNRAAINRNNMTLIEHQRIVNEQTQVLTYLCRTVALLDAGYVQQALIARESISDLSLPLSVRNRWRERLRIYTVIHNELADTKACRKIE